MTLLGRAPIVDGKEVEVKYDDFYENETWSLDITLAQFLLPRLRLYLDHDDMIPPDEREVLLEGLTLIAEEKCCMPDKETLAKAEAALDILRKYFLGMWW